MLPDWLRRFTRRRHVPAGPVIDLSADELLDSWADMMVAHLKVDKEDVDRNGVSDQGETRAKILALRAGAAAIRSVIVKH